MGIHKASQKRISLIPNQFGYGMGGERNALLVMWSVERTSKNERAWAVAAAAAHDWNDELTVILNSISASIQIVGPDHPARPLLLELQSAAQRCAWKASGLLNYTASNGTRPGAAPMEALIGG